MGTLLAHAGLMATQAAGPPPSVPGWNPADATSSFWSFTDSNKVVSSAPAVSGIGGVRGGAPRSTGKFYFEVQFVAAPSSGDSVYVGLASATYDLETAPPPPVAGQYGMYRNDGTFFDDGGNGDPFTPFTNSDVIGVAADLDGGAINFYLNGSEDPINNVFYSVEVGLFVYPILVTSFDEDVEVALLTAEVDFQFTPPVDYLPWG